MVHDDKTLRKYTQITAALASFLTPFMGSSINLAIPSIGMTFNGSAVTLSWLVSGFLLVTAVLLLPVGRIADIWGRKKIFVSGILIFSVFSLLCGEAWSMTSLLTFRILQAVGSAMIFGTGVAILISVFPPEQRGRVLGINVAFVYIGLSLGPVLGGALNHHFGWKSIFLFAAFVGLLIFIFATTKMHGEWADAEDEQFDLSGAVLYMAGISATIYGFSALATSYWAKHIFAAGVIVLAAFVRREARAKHPIMDIRLFSGNITFSCSNIAVLINYSATFAVGFLLSLQLQIIKGFDSQIAGLILLSQPVLMALLSPIAGRLSDEREPRILASLGMGITTLGLIAFIFIHETTPVWVIVLILLLIGAGFALFSSPNTNAIMGSVDKKLYGVATSILGTMRLIGQALSMALATLIIDLYIGDVALNLAPQHTLEKSIEMSFAVFAVLCFIGIFASLARGNRKGTVTKSGRKPD